MNIEKKSNKLLWVKVYGFSNKGQNQKCHIRENGNL